MQQQPLGTHGIMVEYISLLVRRYVHAVNYHLAVVDLAVALLKVKLPLTNGFNFGAEKLNAGLYFFVYEKLVVCAFVLRENFYSFCCCRHVSHSPFFRVWVCFSVQAL